MQKNDEKKRIEGLKRQAEQMGMEATWDSGPLSFEEHERLWRNIVGVETAPLTTLLQQLRDAGCELPDPESMTDDQLTVKLGEVIDAPQETPLLPFSYRAVLLLDRFVTRGEQEANPRRRRPPSA
jgi:hypothetical protein